MMKKNVFAWVMFFVSTVYAANGNVDDDVDSIPSMDDAEWMLLSAGTKRTRTQEVEDNESAKRARKLALKRENYARRQDLKSDAELKADRKKFHAQNKSRWAVLTAEQRQFINAKKLAYVAALPKEVRQKKWQEKQARYTARLASLPSQEREAILEARRARKRELYAINKMNAKQKKARKK